MMQYKEIITRANAMDIIRRFAKEYRKTLGKAPAEIIIVGGGSIMLNYKFRDLSDCNENDRPQRLSKRHFRCDRDTDRRG